MCFKIQLLLALTLCCNSVFAQNKVLEDSVLINILEKIEDNRNPNFVLGLIQDSVDIGSCKNDSLKSRVYYHLGRAHGQLGDFDKSLEALSSGAEVSEKLPESRIGIAMAQGNIYWAKDYYRTALEIYQSALTLSDSFEGDQFVTFQIMLLGNIAGIYSKLEDYEQALLYAKRSVALGYKAEKVRARGHLKLGTILIDVGAYQEALDSLSVTEQFIFQQRDSIALVHCWLAKGMAFKGLSHMDSAMYYISQSASIGDKLKYQIHETLLVEGEINESKGNLPLALANYKGALELAKEKSSLNGQMEAYEKMSGLFKKRKQFEEAYKYAELGVALKDSISSVDVINRINELNTKYETEKKEQQIAALEQKNQIQVLEAQRQKQIKIFSIVAAILLLLASILFYNRYRIKKNTNELLDVKNQELARLNNTKNRLFSIISHDLKSPLSSFHTITKSLSDNWEMLDKDQLKEFIISLRDSSSDVKNMMDNLLKWALAQTGELKYTPKDISSATVIQQVRAQLESVTSLKQINIVTDMEEVDMIKADQQFLEIVIRNLLSNAVKFSAVDSEIKVLVSDQDGTQVISIRDQGVGMDQAQIDQLLVGNIVAQDIQNSSEKGTGLGLSLCKELLNKMGAEMKVVSEKGKGTTFNLLFPKAA
ncbi:MAG: ATP-binding protein [Cyclobacteriaceae bacterium]